MAEYIDRNELVKNLDRFAPEHLTPLIRSLIEKQPTADVVEAKHGEWEGLECSKCGHFATYANDYNYCPNCGAKMEGGVE